MNIKLLVFGSNPRRTAVRIVVLAVVCLVVFGWVLIPIRAEGISMMPTYRSGTYNLVNRFAYSIQPPRRGDVVAIRLAGPRVMYVKRIVGLPGERVRITEGQVTIDGIPLTERYVRHRRPWDVEEVTLGPLEYYVVGDNRDMAAGEHDFGRVSAARILGKVIF